MRPFQLAKLLESLLLARLLKSEDTLSEILIRSMSFIVGPEEATTLGALCQPRYILQIKGFGPLLTTHYTV